MSFEQDAAAVVAESSRSVLTTLGQWVDRMRAKAAEVQDLELRLELAKQELNNLTMVQVPTVMQEAGLTEIKLDDGSTLSVRKTVQANITEANRPAAHAWLRQHGHGAIIKQEMRIDLRAVPEYDKDKILEQLSTFEIDPSMVEAVHPATLRSVVAQELERGVTIPPCIGVFEVTKAQLK